MKTTPVLACIVASIVTLPSAVRADTEPEPQAYFELTVSKGSWRVGKPHALVRVGSEAKLSFAGAGEGAPPIGVRYLVDRNGGGLAATVTALVSGKAVASRTLSFTRERGAAASFEGGGYTWQVTAAVMPADGSPAPSSGAAAKQAFLGCGKVPPGKPAVKMTFKPDTSLRDLLGFMSAISCAGIVVSDGLPLAGPVKILAPKLVTTEQAYDFLAAALAASGLSIQMTGQLLHVVQASPPG